MLLVAVEVVVVVAVVSLLAAVLPYCCSRWPCVCQMSCTSASLTALSEEGLWRPPLDERNQPWLQLRRALLPALPRALLPALPRALLQALPRALEGRRLSLAFPSFSSSWWRLMFKDCLEEDEREKTLVLPPLLAVWTTCCRFLATWSLCLQQQRQRCSTTYERAGYTRTFVCMYTPILCYVTREVTPVLLAW